MLDRPYMLAVTGSFSVGKTTLVKALGDQLSTTHSLAVVDEVARQLIAASGTTTILQKGATQFPMELWIIAKQMQLEGDAIFKRPEIVLLDRGVIDAWAYIQIKYPGAFSAAEGRLYEQLVLEHARRYDLVVDIPIEFGIMLDDVRDDDIAFQAELDDMMRSLWKRAGTPRLSVTGSVPERVAQVTAALPWDIAGSPENVVRLRQQA